MKSKKSLYFLVPAVLAVWGLIISRIIDYKRQNESFSSSVDQEIFVNSQTETNDSIRMLWVYRDPFLDRPAELMGYEPDLSIKSNNASNIKIGSYTPKASEIKQPWPTITYLGIIRNKINGKMVAVFNINGKQVLLSEKQSSEGIRVESADNNKAVVSFGDESKTIEK
ncbi:MAG: hypothetical protein CVU11_06430 [Bacteroidetes bacterium HGW-Bacteroidetes-6]|jgi:hypothetical protein|nr:MAG: hypothetical protein CVU11_06430 [Bacteroidetes bacterium HGW-Bacteroidetes-6]